MICAFILIALVISAQTLPVQCENNNNRTTKHILLAGAVVGLYCGNAFIGKKTFEESNQEEMSLFDLGCMGVSMCIGMAAALVGFKYSEKYKRSQLANSYSASYMSAIKSSAWKKKQT